MNFEILVATNNEHKLKEIRQILSPHKITVYGMKDLNIDIGDVEENGKTYFDNALIKALALQKVTKMPIIADDTGLEIAAMNNAPGLYTARFAKEYGGFPSVFNEVFKRIEGKDRSATFVCDIVLVNVEDKPLRFEARIPGHIATNITNGDGFGYDPIFICDELNKTYAEMGQEEKNRVSHRGKALNKLLTYLKVSGLIHP
jgi:XTP/dITP diphosphohydrolase